MRGPDDGTLFLTNLCEPLPSRRITQPVLEYVDAGRLNKRGRCRLFRQLFHCPAVSLK